MNFGQIDTFVIFGGGATLVDIARWTQDRGHAVTVFTSPRHASESVGDDGETFQSALESSNISVYVADDINDDPNLAGHVTDTTLGLAMGPAWIFREGVLELFSGRVVNFHGIPLPKIRGGGHYTWQILMGDDTGGCNIQLIERRLDAGKVIKTLEYKIDGPPRIPRDYFEAASSHDLPFLKEFVQEVERGTTYEPFDLDEDTSTYYPRLNTAGQGLIDWNWSGTEIERFICAFDDPYPGASTMIGDRRLFLKDCHLLEGSAAFHPYQSGLVVRRRRSTVHVATTSGELAIRSVTDEHGEDGYSSLSRGDRFHTPVADLDQSRRFVARYTGTGLNQPRGE